jgi:hypothetical protein
MKFWARMNKIEGHITLADASQMAARHRGLIFRTNRKSAIRPSKPAGIVRINGKFHNASIVSCDRPT